MHHFSSIDSPKFAIHRFCANMWSAVGHSQICWCPFRYPWKMQGLFQLPSSNKVYSTCWVWEKMILGLWATKLGDLQQASTMHCFHLRIQAMISDSFRMIAPSTQPVDWLLPGRKTPSFAPFAAAKGSSKWERFQNGPAFYWKKGQWAERGSQTIQPPANPRGLASFFTLKWLTVWGNHEMRHHETMKINMEVLWFPDASARGLASFHIEVFRCQIHSGDFWGPTSGCRFQFHYSQIQSGDRFPCKHAPAGFGLDPWFKNIRGVPYFQIDLINGFRISIW